MGSMNGHHEYTYDNGDLYSGEFKDGKRCGKGIYTSIKGHKYDGMWENDMRNVSYLNIILHLFNRDKVQCYSHQQS